MLLLTSIFSFSLQKEKLDNLKKKKSNYNSFEVCSSAVPVPEVSLQGLYLGGNTKLLGTVIF